MFEKSRLLELLHDYVLFDGGIKKLQGASIFWYQSSASISNVMRAASLATQGSGKSIVMVLLTKWILENNPDARVVIITDRDELDKQIEGVFADAGEQIKRATSGGDLLTKLSSPPRACSASGS